MGFIQQQTDKTDQTDKRTDIKEPDNKSWVSYNDKRRRSEIQKKENEVPYRNSFFMVECRRFLMYARGARTRRARK